MAEFIMEFDDAIYDEKTGMSVFKPRAVGELIRCKNCKHRYIENEVWACPFGLAGGPDFYCGYGAERREDG